MSRFDWQSIKDHIDLEAVAESLLGPPAKREGGRLLWCCPFHDDRHPSFQVDPRRNRWRCWTCGIGGDAVDLVMKLNGAAFPDAARIVAELSGVTLLEDGPRSTPRPAAPTARKPTKSVSPPPARPSGLPLDEASALAVESVGRLWGPRGKSAMTYLHDRGLKSETIEVARLGWTPGVMVLTQKGNRWEVRGVTIPWFDGDRLLKINIRRPEGSKPKYAEAFRDRPLIYRDPAIIRIGEPLIVCEGEFEQMLLSQELPEASVITLGSAYSSADKDVFSSMMRAPEWFIALDADEAGERAAAKFPAWAVRVPLPEGDKDWTEVHRGGPNRIRYYWGRYLPMSKSWNELEPKGGLTDNDESSGLVPGHPIP